MSEVDSTIRYFGIRHHGPGCARSLRQALDAWRPQCVLMEGPPEAEPLLMHASAEQMRPPVALLCYCPEQSALASYFPFAVFSPEWQALQWAAGAHVPLHLIDLPTTHVLALEDQDQQRRSIDAPTPDVESGRDATPDGATSLDPAAARRDPLDWYARATGHADGESWWNHMVEERGEANDLFAAIDVAMTTLRNELTGSNDIDPESDQAHLEMLREAHMRQCIRAAARQGHARIAVVCGAWHLAGLKRKVRVSADTALLKGLPKVKLHCTWVPWTYRHLSCHSGYGAGVRAPGWYEHLWMSGERADAADLHARSAGWLARIARLMRQRDLDCSSAHLIEATRLAQTLAALRDRPAPALEELHEAARTVLFVGDDSRLAYIEDELLVGDRIGQVPPEVPTVPLQRDLERQQRSLRLKPEASQRTLDLDLRQPGDLARSHLLHRLGLLGLPWGELARTGRHARGSFHEIWTLQWQPDFALRLIEASHWGQTVEAAAATCAIERAQRCQRLGELAQLVDTVLLAALGNAVPAVTRALEDRVAISSDTVQLLDALPPLANIFRYGNVRQTDAGQVARVIDSLIVRAAIALPLTCRQIDDEAAHALRDTLVAAQDAVVLRDSDQHLRLWLQALDAIATGDGSHPLLKGLAARLLLDAAIWSTDAAATALSLHLSSGSEAMAAAAWLDGFLNRNAVVLLHDETLWQLVDGWLTGLGDAHFQRILPLVRRTFSAFSAGERRDLAQRAARATITTPVAAATAPAWDPALTDLPVPYLARIMGLEGIDP